MDRNKCEIRRTASKDTKLKVARCCGSCEHFHVGAYYDECKMNPSAAVRPYNLCDSYWPGKTE